MKNSLLKNVLWLSAAILIISCKTETKPKVEDPKAEAIPQIITSPALGDASLPHLFATQDSVYLSWVTKLENGEHSFQFAAAKDTTWSQVDTIAKGKDWFVNWADYPMLTKNGNTFLATFLQRSDSGKYTYDVKYTVKKADSLWRKPKTLHDDATQAEHGFVSLLPYGENFFATWLDGRNTINEDPEKREMTLRSAIIDADGNKLEDQLLDERTCDCCQTTAVIAGDSPEVFYRDRSKGEKVVRDIFYTRLQDSTWSKPEAVYKDNWELRGCPVNGPRAAAKGDNIAVAWFTMAGDTPKVQVIFSGNAGKTFETPIRVDEGNPIGRVDVVLIDGTTAVVSWLESRKDEDVVLAMKVEKDGVRSKPVVIAHSSKERSSGFPQMALLNKTLYFAWTGLDGDAKTVTVATLLADSF